eukprot:COSAG04_NODE_5362_length_1641_cov_8.585603_2_plen_165_part_01
MAVSGSKTMSEGGPLDLSSSDLRPHELVELAPQLTQLTELILDGNGIFGVLPDQYGRGGEPDKFIDQCEPFFAALKDSPITALSLKSTGMGPAACGMLATSFTAAMTELNISTNALTGGKPEAYLDAGEFKYRQTDGGDLSGITALFEAFKPTSIGILDLSDCGL